MSNAQRRREERDARRVRNGLHRRTSIDDRRARAPAAPVPVMGARTLEANRDASLFSRHGLLLPGSTLLAARRRLPKGIILVKGGK